DFFAELKCCVRLEALLCVAAIELLIIQQQAKFPRVFVGKLCGAADRPAMKEFGIVAVEVFKGFVGIWVQVKDHYGREVKIVKVFGSGARPEQERGSDSEENDGRE